MEIQLLFIKGGGKVERRLISNSVSYLRFIPLQNFIKNIIKKPT